MLFGKFSLSILASLALIACGGGGGGGGSSSAPPASAAAPFSLANYSATATPAASSFISIASSGNVLDALSDSSSSGSSAFVRGDTVGMARWALARMNAPLREQAQAVRTINEPCGFSGTISGSADDRDNNSSLSAGDSLTLTANNCRFASGDLPVNGSFSMTVNAITFNLSGDVLSASLSVSFTNFGAAGNTLNGNVSMQFNSTNSSYTASYSNFTSARGSATPTIANITISSNSSQVTASGTLTVNNNTYTLSTPVALVFGLTYPTSGTLRITDAAGGRIDLISSNTNLVFELYLPGDSIRDAQFTTTWASLDNT